MPKPKITQHLHVITVPDVGWGQNVMGAAPLPNDYRAGNPFTLVADQGIKSWWVDSGTLCVVPNRKITACIMIEYRVSTAKAAGAK